MDDAAREFFAAWGEKPCPRCGGTVFAGHRCEVRYGTPWESVSCANCGLWRSGWMDEWMDGVSRCQDESSARLWRG